MQIMDTVWPASECASCRLWTLSGLRVSVLHADYGHSGLLVSVLHADYGHCLACE